MSSSLMRSQASWIIFDFCFGALPRQQLFSVVKIHENVCPPLVLHPPHLVDTHPQTSRFPKSVVVAVASNSAAATVCLSPTSMCTLSSSTAFYCISHTYLRAYFYRQMHRLFLLFCAGHSMHPFVSVFCVFRDCVPFVQLSSTRDGLFARSPYARNHYYVLSLSNTLLTFACMLCISCVQLFSSSAAS